MDTWTLTTVDGKIYEGLTRVEATVAIRRVMEGLEPVEPTSTELAESSADETRQEDEYYVEDHEIANLWSPAAESLTTYR